MEEEGIITREEEEEEEGMRGVEGMTRGVMAVSRISEEGTRESNGVGCDQHIDRCATKVLATALKLERAAFASRAPRCSHFRPRSC